MWPKVYIFNDCWLIHGLECEKCETDVIYDIFFLKKKKGLVVEVLIDPRLQFCSDWKDQ